VSVMHRWIVLDSGWRTYAPRSEARDFQAWAAPAVQRKATLAEHSSLVEGHLQIAYWTVPEIRIAKANIRSRERRAVYSMTDQ